MSRKNIELESSRGIAAFVVLFWHLILGFFPTLSGIFNIFDINISLKGSLTYFLINGSAAVVFFFVLSGYVLSRNFFLTGNHLLIVRNVIKRLPRLAFLTSIVCLFSYLLFSFKIYRFEEVALITNSPWLSKFGFAYQEPFRPFLFDALKQGLYRTFFFGDSYYNSSMWTMRIEFIGSFIVFGLASLMGVRHRKRYADIIFLLIFILTALAQSYFSAFVAGVWLAWHLEVNFEKLTSRYIFLFLFALYLFGYSGDSIGIYFLFPEILNDLRVYVWIVSSLLMLFCILQFEPLNSILRHHLLAYLGRLSFPLYLLHVPVLCSFGCIAYLNTIAFGSFIASLIAVLITIMVSIVLSVMLAYLNDIWMNFLDKLINNFLNLP